MPNLKISQLEQGTASSADLLPIVDSGVTKKATVQQVVDAGITGNSGVQDAVSHVSRTDNPHSVTKAQVGLSNVPNLDTTSAVANDHTHANKPILDQISSNPIETIIAGQNVGVSRVGNSVTITSIGGGGGSGNEGSFAYYSNTATGGQTVVNLSFSYIQGNNSLFVYVNGTKQQIGSHYTESSSSTITFIDGLTVGDTIEVIYPNKGLNWQGAYDNGAAYKKDDAVSYNGSSYICILDSTGNLPTNSTYWNVLAAKGDTGDTGPQGIQGIQGEQGPQGPIGLTGDDGRGIVSVLRTSGDGSPGTTDTYTITYTDATTSTFQVYNGADGIGTVASVSSGTHITVDNTDPNNPVINYNGELFSTTLKNKLDGIEAEAEVNNISDTDATDLTDGGDTSLHTHDGRYYTETEVDTLLLSKVPNNRTLTINGTTYDLSDNRTWTISGGGGGSLNYIAVTSNQSISPSNFYGVTCTTSDITLTLADGTSIGENLTIKKLDNTPYNIPISGNIEQDGSIIIDTQFESIDLFWNGAYYLIK